MTIYIIFYFFGGALTETSEPYLEKTDAEKHLESLEYLSYMAGGFGAFIGGAAETHTSNKFPSFKRKGLERFTAEIRPFSINLK